MEDPRIANPPTAPKMVRGRPIVTAASRGFRNTKDFQQALIANRADRSINTAERTKREAALVARRRAQLRE